MIPIVGQPCSVLNWWPEVLMQCNCQESRDAGVVANLLLLLSIGGQATCNHCHRPYRLAAMAFDPTTKTIQPVIEMGVKL